MMSMIYILLIEAHHGAMYGHEGRSSTKAVSCDRSVHLTPFAMINLMKKKKTQDSGGETKVICRQVLPTSKFLDHIPRETDVRRL
ncbi:unnamed protein product [Musa acuminata subsp. burmannicoides]